MPRSETSANWISILDWIRDERSESTNNGSIPSSHCEAEIVLFLRLHHGGVSVLSDESQSLPIRWSMRLEKKMVLSTSVHSDDEDFCGRDRDKVFTFRIRKWSFRRGIHKQGFTVLKEATR